MVKYLLLALFVGLLVGSGFVSMQRTKTVNDFFLGSRSVGPWLSAFAYGTTYFSAVLFIGYAGKVGWGFGFSALWIALGNGLIGSFLAWRILAKPTRLMTSRLETMTMPSFLEARFNSPKLRTVSALIIFIFLVPYSASVYMGLSYLFEQTFGINYFYANLSIAGLTALFLIMGGYLAVAITDFIQGIIMFFGASAMVYFIFTHASVGGLSIGIQRLAEYNPKLVEKVGPTGVIPLLSLVILTSLGAWGLPQMIQKFYAIKDEQSIKPATTISTAFALVIAFSAYAVGAVSRLFFSNQAPLENGVANFDLVIPKILTEALPEMVMAVILLLVLSASMSTLSSLVLVSSSAVAIDLRRENQIQNDSPALFRLLCLLFIVISLIIAIWRPTFILNLMALSWGTVAGSFIGPYLYGLFWQRTTKAGAWAGLGTGLMTSLLLTLFGENISAWLGLTLKFDAPLVGSLAIVLPLVVVPIISVITAPLPAEVLTRAYGPDYPLSQQPCLAKETAK